MTSKSNLATPAFNSTAWNTPLNANFDTLNTSLGGLVTVNVASGNATLTATQAQNLVISVEGSPGTTRTVFLPNAVTGSWVVKNSTNSTLLVKSDGGGATGTTILSGYADTVYAVVSGASVEVFSATTDLVKKSGDTMVGNLALPSNGLTVGTTQLYVSGGNVYTSGNFFSSSNVTAYNTSDERLKYDIATLDDALEKLALLRGVTFKSKKDDQECIGVIAQEVQSVFPEVVKEGEDGFLHVAYGNLIAVLINAVNDLKKRIEYLEEQG